MRDKDIFSKVTWSVKSLVLGFAMIVFFRVAFYLSKYADLNKFTLIFVSVLWFLMFAGMVLYPVWIVKKQKKIQIPKIRTILKEFLIAIPIVIIILVVNSIVLIILNPFLGITSNDINSEYSFLRDAPNYSPLYFLLIMMITIGPIAEEIFFRGFLYNAIKQKLSVFVSIVILSVLFAALHFGSPVTNIAGLIFVFIPGLIITLAYEWRKTLCSSISIHILNNFTFAGPILVLMIINTHTPAKTWEEAQELPDWKMVNYNWIEKQETGEDQRLYAINTWGSKGIRMWKQEIMAFYAVYNLFPEDREACAKAFLGISDVYKTYLRDFRRAIVISAYVLEEYSDMDDICADALIKIGWSYYQLDDYEKSRAAFQEVVDSYSSIEGMKDSAMEGLEFLENNRKDP
ncbi:MAG: CPBP family intramembrane metalloprotease [Sedimentisphaerales bacterium]|nr:CPBP family intramembrane metalloprotease [Sedimentisphaerales bacterium]